MIVVILNAVVSEALVSNPKTPSPNKANQSADITIMIVETPRSKALKGSKGLLLLSKSRTDEDTIARAMIGTSP